MEYNYTTPTRKWKKRFPRNNDWKSYTTKVKVSMGEESAVIHLVPSTLGKVCLVLLTPLAYVIGTIMDGLPRTHRDVMGAYRGLSKHRRVVIIYKDESEGSDWNILKELVE